MLQCVAVCCSGKVYLAALRKGKGSLSSSAASASEASGVLQCVTVFCSVCMCVAVCACVLQCVAMCRSVSQCVAEHMRCVARHEI